MLSPGPLRRNEKKVGEVHDAVGAAINDAGPITIRRLFGGCTVETSNCVLLGREA